MLNSFSQRDSWGFSNDRYSLKTGRHVPILFLDKLMFVLSLHS